MTRHPTYLEYVAAPVGAVPPNAVIPEDFPYGGVRFSDKPCFDCPTRECLRAETPSLQICGAGTSRVWMRLSAFVAFKLIGY